MCVRASACSLDATSTEVPRMRCADDLVFGAKKAASSELKPEAAQEGRGLLESPAAVVFIALAQAAKLHRTSRMSCPERIRKNIASG